MQRHNEQSIGEILRQFMKVTDLENIVFQEKIAAIWQETMGEAITHETERISMQGGCLYIHLKSPSLRNEILMRRTAIASVLNEKLGVEAIKSIYVR